MRLTGGTSHEEGTHMDGQGTVKAPCRMKGGAGEKMWEHIAWCRTQAKTVGRVWWCTEMVVGGSGADRDDNEYGMDHVLMIHACRRVLYSSMFSDMQISRLRGLSTKPCALGIYSSIIGIW